MPKLSDTALRIILVITDQTLGWIEDPLTNKRKEKDWIAYSQLQQKTGRHSQAISQGLRELEEFYLIEICDSRGDILKTKEERLGKKLFYRLNTSLKIKEDSDNLFENQSLKIKETNITNTKASTNVEGGVVKKQPSCPLLNGSPLREKYPNGHTECVEYLVSCEKDRDIKFINRTKQFVFLHKILQANVDFYTVDKTIDLIEKKNGRGSWDFGTVVGWLDKGGR